MAEVAPPLGLRGIERRVQAHSHQRVLERSPPARVRMHVPGGHARHAEPSRDSLKAPVAGAIVPQERALELDPEAIGTERIEQAPERELVVHPAQRAPAQTDQPLGVLQDVRQLDERLRGRGGPGAGGLVAGAGGLWGGAGAGGRDSFSRVCACASVRMRQRLDQPPASSTSNVRCLPSERSISAPWIGRNPSARAETANSIEPETELWSVSATAS